MPTQDDEQEIAGLARSETAPEEPTGFSRSEVGDDDADQEEQDGEGQGSFKGSFKSSFVRS
jgi:hypothetical protein